MNRELEVISLGRIRYAEAMAIMEARAEQRRRGLVPDVLYLLEHEPVLTYGRRAAEANLLLSSEALAARGVELYESTRGGDFTYHGPGQLVAYPVLDLSAGRKDVRRYVCDLEEVMIRSCARYGVAAGRVDGLIGAWVEGQRKIGAIGVRISRWITTHGFALNVNTDLSDFQMIVPCGISDRGVTSLALERRAEFVLEEVMEVVEEEFRTVFDSDKPRSCG